MNLVQIIYTAMSKYVKFRFGMSVWDIRSAGYRPIQYTKIRKR